MNNRVGEGREKQRIPPPKSVYDATLRAIEEGKKLNFKNIGLELGIPENRITYFFSRDYAHRPRPLRFAFLLAEAKQPWPEDFEKLRKTKSAFILWAHPLDFMKHLSMFGSQVEALKKSHPEYSLVESMCGELAKWLGRRPYHEYSNNDRQGLYEIAKVILENHRPTVQDTRKFHDAVFGRELADIEYKIELLRKTRAELAADLFDRSADIREHVEKRGWDNEAQDNLASLLSHPDLK